MAIEAAFDGRLKDEVLPVAAAMQLDTARGIPAEQVFADLRKLHAEMLRDRVG